MPPQTAVLPPPKNKFIWKNFTSFATNVPMYPKNVTTGGTNQKKILLAPLAALFVPPFI